MPLDPTQKQERKRKSNSLNANNTTPKGKLLGTPQRSHQFYIRGEIPMAWGTTTDSLTLEINPFQYAIEIKCLTLKDQTSYLISDG